MYHIEYTILESTLITAVNVLGLVKLDFETSTTLKKAALIR